MNNHSPLGSRRNPIHTRDTWHGHPGPAYVVMFLAFSLWLQGSGSTAIMGMVNIQANWWGLQSKKQCVAQNQRFDDDVWPDRYCR